MLALRFVACFVCLLAVACDDAPSFLGIGRAPSGARSQTAVLPISLTRLYVPTILPAGAVPYVDIALSSTSPDIDLSRKPLYLLSHTALVKIGATNIAAGASIRVQDSNLTALGLHTNAGELAVVDGQLSLHAYAAWGTTPSAWSQNFVAQAQARGLLLGTQHVAMPYPLGDAVALNLDANAASACLTADPNVSATSPQGPITCPATSAALQLSRVQPAGLDTPAGWIEIHNAQGAAIDVHGLSLCIDSICGAIEARAQNNNTQVGVLAANTNTNAVPGSIDASRAIIRLGTPPAGASVAASALVAPSLPRLTAQSELALFAPGSNPNATLSQALSYVRLGTGAKDPNALPLLAKANIAIGAWQAQGLVVPRVGGESQARNTSLPDAAGPSAWALSASAPLTVVADPATPWTSCTAPKNPAPANALQVVQISRSTVWRIILQNNSATPLDVSGYQLQLGTQSLALDALTLPIAPGASVWVELSPSDDAPCTAHQDVCWLGAETSLGAGALRLTRAGVVVGYVQWVETAGTAQSAQDAISAGAWPNTSCTIEGFDTTGASTDAIRLLPSARGQSPADYFLGTPSRL